jgi:NADH-quinone oxidoreductase subunit G
MAKMITLSIDGKKVTVPEGMMVVDAAKQAGINIPVFCYHPKMEPVGMCRMCLVEIGRPMIDRASGEVIKESDGSPRIQFGPKMETSCTTPVSEGMTVVTDSVKVKRARKEMLEFLLTSHPLDCPICDKGGECPLQNLTLEHGPGESRFQFNEKSHQDKHVALGELIFLDRERCIQCGRCVRFQSEIAGDPVLGFTERGRAMEITTRSTPGFDSIFSGNTTDICPVGALTTADFRFGARPWEMKYTSSICNHCPVGCNMVYNVRREARSDGRTVIKRVMPRQNEAVNEIWICDKGRLGYNYIESPKRLTHPMVRKDGKLVEVSWDEAYQTAGRGLSLSKNLAILAGGRLSNEDYFNLSKLAEARKGKMLLYSYMAGGDLTAQLGLGKGSNLANLGAKSAILVVASDLHEEAPLWWLRVKQAAKRGADVIVITTHPTRLDAFARYVVRCEPGHEVEMLKAFLPENHGRNPEALRTAAEAFAKAVNGVIFYGSDGLGLQSSQAVAHACAELLIKTDHVGRPDNGLVAVWHAANLQGAWDMGFRPDAQLEITLAASDGVIISGADPVRDDPAMAATLKSPEVFTIVQELFLTETARLADVVLPVAASSEREGSYTSGERRVQRYYPIQIAANLKPDYAVTACLAMGLGVSLEDRSASLVMEQISAKVDGYAGLTYARLAEFAPQFPDVGRSELYYGGTTYENRQGLGIQLDIDTVHSRLMKIPEQAAPVLPLPQAGELVILPVTALYDRGNLITETTLLDQRREQPILRLSSQSAQNLGLVDGATCEFDLGKVHCSLKVELDDSLPVGVGFAARSMGLPLVGPVVVKPIKAG